MKKNNYFVFGFLLIVSVLFFNLGSSLEVVDYNYDLSSSGIQIMQLKYEPYPVSPGDYFDIYIKVNIGLSVNYVKFELVEDFPFSLDNNENATRIFEGSGLNEVVLKYTVRVDKNAVESENKLKLKIITKKNTNDGMIQEFNINVINPRTDFDAVIQDSTTSAVSIALANIGKNVANSIIVRVPEQDEFILTGSDGQMVGNLDAGDYTIVSFSGSLNSRIKEPTFKFDIYYTDNIGERRVVNMELPLSSLNSNLNNEGNFSNLDFQFMGRERQFQKKSSISIWYIISGISLLIIIVVFFLKKRYPEKFNDSLKKISFKLKRNKTTKEKKSKDDSETPDWIKNFKNKDSKVK